MKRTPATTKKTMASALLHRAANYRRFLPDWPALADSLEREAKALLAPKSVP